MKCNTTMTALNFVLAALVILSVALALLTIHRERTLRHLTLNATTANIKLTQGRALLKDTVVYNTTAQSAELTQIIKSVETKPATR